jgi:hypothetical protein
VEPEIIHDIVCLDPRLFTSKGVTLDLLRHLMHYKVVHYSLIECNSHFQFDLSRSLLPQESPFGRMHHTTNRPHLSEDTPFGTPNSSLLAPTNRA